MCLFNEEATLTNQRFAVLIPVFNEEPVINDTISSLLKANIPADVIHIVDDCSPDATATLVRAAGIKCFTTPENCGKARAQTAALAHFNLLHDYDWVIFLDGDTKVSKDFFSSLVEAATNDPASALFVGQVQAAESATIFSAARAVEYTFGHDVVKQGQANCGVIFVSPGCASMYRTDVLSQLVIDHETLAEDMDLTMQVHRLGKKISYVDEAVVHTQDPATLHDYNKQVLRWARGLWQVVKKHGVFSLQRKQRVDWYLILLLLDSIILNRVVGLASLALISPALVLPMIGVDVCISIAIAIYASIKLRRLDVIYKFPAYYWLSYINFALFIRAFFEIIVLRKTLLAWNKVARYNFQQVE